MNNRKLSEEAGLDQDVYTWNQIQIERFAKLVAAAEREACAELCRKNAHLTTGLHHAAAIRARENNNG